TQGPYAYDSEGKLVQVGKQWDFVFNAVGSPDKFKVNWPGQYVAKMQLFGKKAGESEGDYRELCSPVEKVVVLGAGVGPDEFTGEISKVQARTGVANWGAYPLSLEQGVGYSIAVTVVNRSSIPLVLYGELTITKPSGNSDFASDFTGTAIPPHETTVAPDASHTFKWNLYPLLAFIADEVGDYEGSFVLKGKAPGQPDSGYKALCDPWEDILATVTGVAPPDGPTGKAEIVRKALDFELIGSGYEIPVT
ncbi:unnamed protein product, partial [marine sediment metagenome]